MSKRDDILDRAEELFTEHGFHGVSLAAIAVAAGLGNAGLIHHFPTKRKLYREVLRRLGDELEGVVSDALTGATGPREKLATVVRVVGTWSLQRSGRARLMMRELLDNVDRVDKARTLPLARFLENARDLVTAAQAEGLVRDGEPLAILAQLFGSIAYAQIARPTFAKILGGKLLADDRRWMATIVADLEQTLFA
ncbi:MAG TPA: helix-turn-helix domain-containing protein [Kofleriaceae bacterium]|jgi:AcrR family transcriptional regulator